MNHAWICIVSLKNAMKRHRGDAMTQPKHYQEIRPGNATKTACATK